MVITPPSKPVPLKAVVFVIACFLQLVSSHAFALLGPFEPWQTPALGYNPLGMDIGAPKELGDEYRWNVPVITYGVDRAFMDFFGEAGVRAVNDAFAILNQLPPASDLVLTNFGIDTRRINMRAEAANLVDLKSTVLSLALEQLGLASSERYVWTLRDRKIIGYPNSFTNYLVLNRNFDPNTFEQSPFVNEGRYSYEVEEIQNPFFADAFEHTVDPDHSIHAFASVSSFAYHGGFFPAPPSGVFLFWLTRDDAGGLRYLLSPSNLNFEPLPDDVTLADPSDGTELVKDALRPGVDKLQFVFVGDSWQTTANWSAEFEWIDTYFEGGVRKQQRVKRIQRRPNIVFSAADLGTFLGSVHPLLFSRSAPNWKRTAQSVFPGPGILQGSVTLTLAKTGRSFINEYPNYTTEATAMALPLPLRWGSFDATLVDPIIYPQRTTTEGPRLLSEAQITDPGRILLWIPDSGNATFMLESSPDLQSWTPTGSILSSENHFSARVALSGTSGFFRVAKR